MSAPVLPTNVNLESPEAKARDAHNRALAKDLHEKVATAALGGNEKSRARHVSRGKLLPRDRVERLLDPGSPLLELGQLAANGLYGEDIPSSTAAGPPCRTRRKSSPTATTSAAFSSIRRT